MTARRKVFPMWNGCERGSKMQKNGLVFRVALLCMVLLWACAMCRAEEGPVGFGFARENGALHDAIGGAVQAHLPKDCAVWIEKSAPDAKGEIWYAVNTGMQREGKYRAYEGWMKAEDVEAGAAVWQDVAEVCAYDKGMIARKKDGKVIAAGRPLLNPEGSAWVSPRTWAAAFSNIRQACILWNGQYALLDEEGNCFPSEGHENPFGGAKVRLMEGKSDGMFGLSMENELISLAGWPVETQPFPPETLEKVVNMQGNDEEILLLTEEGELLIYPYSENFLGTPPPDWGEWTELADVDTAWIFSGDYPTWMPCVAYAGVRQDGTVLAFPEKLSDAVSQWQGMKEVEIGNHWLVGLKADGTAVSVGLEDFAPPDVSAFSEVERIEAGFDFCVGIRKDGTLVFAGTCGF